MATNRDYSIIRLLILALYGVAIVLLLGGVTLGALMWLRADALQAGQAPTGPLSSALDGLDSNQLIVAAAVTAAGGIVGFLLIGAFGQVLATLRDTARNAAVEVQLLQDILELNQRDPGAPRSTRVDLCQGCHRLAALQAIESGQWVCRECRRQMRSV